MKERFITALQKRGYKETQEYLIKNNIIKMKLIKKQLGNTSVPQTPSYIGDCGLPQPPEVAQWDASGLPEKNKLWNLEIDIENRLEI